MARTGWKVWCDQGISLVPWENFGGFEPSVWEFWAQLVGIPCCNFQVLPVELHVACFGSLVTNVVSTLAKGAKVYKLSELVRVVVIPEAHNI